MARGDGVGSTRTDEDVVVVTGQRPAPPARGAAAAVPERRPVRQDRVRWGPVWAGSLVVVTTFLVMQLVLFALGWLDLGFDGSNSAVATTVVSGVLALAAFFLGAVAAAGTALWRSASDGMVNGVLVWALSVSVLLLLGLLGGTALLGPLATLVSQSPAVPAPGDLPVDPATAASIARQSAGWAALGMGLAAGAAALGGALGAKLWPGEDTARSS